MKIKEAVCNPTTCFPIVNTEPDQRLVHLDASEALTVHMSRGSGPEASFCNPSGLPDGETQEHSRVSIT